MGTRRKNAVFAVLCCTCIVLAFLSTALNTVLPSIARDFAIDVTCAQWVVSGYAIALAAIMPLSAFLIHRFPTRHLYLMTVGLHLACSLICALSSSFALLLVARIVQACANGIIANLTQVSILSLFEEGERGTRMGWFGLSVGAAPVLAPTLGGLLADTIGWRAIFLLAALLLAISIIGAYAVMGNVLDLVSQRFDVRGFIASALGIGGVTLGLGNLSSFGFLSASTWVPLLTGVFSLCYFARHQLTCSQPLLNLRILKPSPYLASVAGSAALYAIMMGSAAALPLFLQTQLGTSATVAGMVVLPGAAAMALTNPLAGKVLDRFGIKKLAIVAGVMLVAGTALVCLPPLSSSLFAQALLALARSLAIGLIQMPLVVWGNASLRQADLASGTTLLTSIRNIAGALGIVAFVGLLSTFGIGASFACMAVAALAIPLPAFIERSDRKNHD